MSSRNSVAPLHICDTSPNLAASCNRALSCCTPYRLNPINLAQLSLHHALLLLVDRQAYLQSLHLINERGPFHSQPSGGPHSTTPDSLNNGLARNRKQRYSPPKRRNRTAISPV